MKYLNVNTENGTTKIIINRPEKFNSFDLDLISDMAGLLISCAMDPSVEGIIISGNGRAFCAGGDLEWAARHKNGAACAFHELSSRFHQCVTEISSMAKPVIAAINGTAAGGGFALAMACDFRVMASTAILRQGYTSSGLSMDGGATFTLPRLVGHARAMEIAAFDMNINAEQALQWGLITRIADGESLMEEADLLMEGILSNSANSFGWSKRLLKESFSTSMEQQMEKERAGLSHCADHEDGRQGIEAFLNKRPPVFKKRSGASGK